MATQHIKKRKLTKGEVAFLRFLYDGGPASRHAIKRAMTPYGFLRGYGTRFISLLNRMEDVGYIHATSGESEGRKYRNAFIRITGEGKARLESHNPSGRQ